VQSNGALEVVSEGQGVGPFSFSILIHQYPTKCAQPNHFAVTGSGRSLYSDTVPTSTSLVTALNANTRCNVCLQGTEWGCSELHHEQTAAGREQRETCGSPPQEELLPVNSNLFKRNTECVRVQERRSSTSYNRENFILLIL
jgi:hypothetical protein